MADAVTVSTTDSSVRKSETFFTPSKVRFLKT